MLFDNLSSHYFASLTSILQLTSTNRPKRVRNSCNNKRVVFGAVVQHIIGEGHCKKVAKIYRDKESIIYSKLPEDANVAGDEAVASDEATGQVAIPALPDYNSILQATANAGKKSPTKRKTPKKNVSKNNATFDDGDSQTALTVQGGLIVNGLDIVKYIRGLEGRISELESKLAAATSTEVTTIENTNLV